MNIFPAKTAISRNKPSKGLQVFLGHAIEDNTCPRMAIPNREFSFLDYGCGKGFDVEYMRSKGFDMKGYDKHQDDYDCTDVLERDYDYVFLTYVLNTIPSRCEREDVLMKAYERCTKGLIVSIRTDKKSIKEHWEKAYDGYITKRKTFQKFYDSVEFRMYVFEVLGRPAWKLSEGVYYIAKGKA